MIYNVLEYIRIDSEEAKLATIRFLIAWELYRRSFPDEERRHLTSQRNIMKNPQYHFETIFMNKTDFVGFIAWWEFDNLRYVEHFATAEYLRGEGYGTRILNDFTKRSQVPILLEVALPSSDTDKRRIGFYQRAGFVLNEQPYKHPPYKKGKYREYVPLMLMTWPNAITDSELQYFLEKCHPIIHKLVLK